MTKLHQPFISRVGLLKNLQQHLLRGRWAAMIGGPMIGKTSLTTQLAKRINAEEGSPMLAILVPSAETKSPSQFWSFMADSISNQGFSQGLSLESANKIKKPRLKPANPLSDPDLKLQALFVENSLAQASRKLILLIDDCDHLLNLSKELVPEILALAQVFKGGEPALHAICWIGSPTWGDWIRENNDLFKVPVRTYPLSVIPIRESYTIIRNQLGPAEVDRIWKKTGGHPYLLEKMIEGREATSETRSQMETLSKRLRQDLKPEEKAILSQLDPEGSWTALEGLRGRRGGHPEKKIFDRLCMLGVIVRTLNQCGAAVRITSPLLFKNCNDSPHSPFPP